MFQRFYPNEYVNSTYQIDFEDLYKRGYRGVLFDIDNTLVPHGEPATEEVAAFFERLRKIGFRCCLISNNKYHRIYPFHQAVKVDFIDDAHKPSTKGYVAAMKKMHTDKGNTLFVGDQLFTDVYGANRAGIYSILVKPIHPKEEIQIVLKRYLEKIVLHFYKRQHREQ